MAYQPAQPAHFFDPAHQQIYRAASQLIGDGQAATPTRLAPFFESAAAIGPGLSLPAYLMRLATNATTIINARDYGRTIYDLAVRRQLILIGEDMVRTAFDSPIDFPPKEQIEEAETRLFALVERGEGDRGEIRFADAVAAARRAVRTARNDTQLVRTGFKDLDDMLGGMRPGELILLAARPSMGKTSLATNIAVNVAQDWLEPVDEDGVVQQRRRRAVGFFSQEMAADQIALRIIGELAEISPSKARVGLNESDLERFEASATAAANDINIVIDETAGLSITQLRSRARRMKRKYQIDLVVVDYLQLMNAGRKVENRNLEITAITAGLKGLAKELGVPVLVLSQLSRGVEQRADERPQLADLRDSGAIEQDADVVMFLYREEYYLQCEKPPLAEPARRAEWEGKLAKVGGLAEVIIAKQRQGATGIVTLQFSDELMRFSGLARQGA